MENDRLKLLNLITLNFDIVIFNFDFCILN